MYNNPHMKAVFLDRDGTINVELGEGKINSPDKIILLPSSLQALSELSKLDYQVFLVTNQLGISMGSYDENQFHKINQALLQLIEPTGIKIAKTYFCPHALEANCDCHKPKPGMLLRAAQEYDIDLASSWVVGDRPTDVGAGMNAGTKTILLENGAEPTAFPGAKPSYVAEDLLEAVRYIAAH